MRVLVLNAGSSSLKFQVIEPGSATVTGSGSVERIGEPGQAPDHVEAVRGVLEQVSASGAPPDAVGHRVVHGGDRFDRATIIDAGVLDEIESLSALAPLHNPANAAGIRAVQRVLPQLPQVAVFDTAFHQTMPPEAWRYAIDRVTADTHRIRRYGFHGTSHKYVSERVAAFLNRPIETLRTIVLHLGNGASACAVQGGRSVDTSMGLTPLQGLVMGTRSGDVDPAVLLQLQRSAGLDADRLDDLLNKRSGLLGLAGSADMRDVQRAAAGGDPHAVEALAIWGHRVRHYIGAYAALMGGVDAIAFTGGIGENNAPPRRHALDGLGFMGIHVDETRNALDSRAERRISPDGAAVEVLVIPTNEELEIARQTVVALSTDAPAGGA